MLFYLIYLLIKFFTDFSYFKITLKNSSKMSIKNLLQELFKNLQNLQNSDEVIAFLLDCSASTGATFIRDSNNNIVTVLQKELAIVKELATLNINGTNILFIFNFIGEKKGEIKISSNGNIMIPPGIRSNSITNTHLGFEVILSSLNETKITKVVLITDGQTNSKPDDIKRLSVEFDKKGIELVIYGVSDKPIDFSSVSSD